MLQTWFKIFFRNSKKNWLNLVINILGLTVGFAGLLIVLLYFNDEQSYNASNKNVNEIYRAIHKMSDGDIWASSTNVEGAKYKEDIPEITDIYLSNAWTNSSVVKIDGKQLFIEDILKGTSNFFSFFPFKIIEGSPETFVKGKNHIAISEKQAKILFGKKSAIAGSIILFLLGMEMVLGLAIFQTDETDISSAHVMPLAFPMIAGAGSMTTILTLKSTYETPNIFIGILLNILFVYIVLKSCKYIERKIGPNGANMLRKIFGIRVFGPQAPVINQQRPVVLKLGFSIPGDDQSAVEPSCQLLYGIVVTMEPESTRIR